MKIIHSKVLIETSARHLHLKKEDAFKLFGKKDYKLHKTKKLSQPFEFACQETLIVKGPKNKLKLRVVGPYRKKTQVELSITDCVFLGIKPYLRLSGDLRKSSPIEIIGPKGRIKIKQGAIVPLRHLHLSKKEAKKLKLKNGEKIAIKIKGKRGLIFQNVIVRVSPYFKMACHLDTDEGNAAGINKKTYGQLIKL